MKNFFKTLVGIGILAAIAGAIYYVYKNYLQDKDFDDLDEDDFEDFDDLDEENATDSRGYVTLNMESASAASSADADDAPTDSSAEAANA